ncbi:MAG TPA: FliA/WhiG family RNA polymerase sigma factor [Deltaproteobacteria bacterium]|nr:FliA/WhiG family RNA polymerase sigma factor [Deltaproteobacteria bacterium]
MSNAQRAATARISQVPDLHTEQKRMQTESDVTGARAYGSTGGPPRLVEGMTREHICAKYHDKVFLVARRIHERLSRNATVQLDDMVAWGAIGLLEAFERYDASKGVKFSTYAEHRIRGTIYDALRARDTSTRRRRDLAKRIEAARQRLLRQYQREPEPEEIADELGVDLERYWSAVEATKQITVVSYDTPDEEGRPLMEVLAEPGRANAEQRMLAHEVRQQLRAAIQELPERQRHCLVMYYDREMSLAEIGAVYGVSVSRISQILSETRLRLRRRLRSVIDLSDIEGVK